MKINKVIFALSCVAFGVMTTVVKAQSPENSKWKGFTDQNGFVENFESKTEQLIKTDVFLSPEQASAQLQAVEGKKIHLPKVKLRSKMLNSAEIAQVLKPSFVAFATAYNCGKCHRTHMGTASGYVISEDGLLVTNHHVVESYIKGKTGTNLAMSVQTQDGEVYLVKEIVSSFKDADLTIVKVDTRGKKLSPLPLGNTANTGDDVYVLSNPAPMINYFTTGKVARNYIGQPQKGAEKLPLTDITADYAAGSSGAPIVDHYGNLVSTVSSTQSIYYNPVEQKSLQMVVKTTRPVVLLKQIVEYN